MIRVVVADDHALGPLAELSDYLAFIALATIGLQVLRTRTEHLEPSPSLADGIPATP